MGLSSVSVVLNVYKRGKLFESQLRAIEGQTHRVAEILVWENGEDCISEFDESVTVRARANSNLGVWARFAFALNARSDFIWLIDDDSIPGPRFLENALTTFESNPGVIGSRGLVFRTTNSYALYDEFGPLNPNNSAERVDIVGHNWIFPREWLAYFWAEVGNKFPSELAGEDIHLSYAIQKHLGLPTLVPPHPLDDLAVWGDTAHQSGFGADQFAISKNPAASLRFEKALAHYRARGFKTLVQRQPAAPGALIELQGALVSKAPALAHKLAKALGIKKRPSR